LKNLNTEKTLSLRCPLQKRSPFLNKLYQSLRWFFLAVIFAFGLFFVGFDQGHLFSIVQGVEAFDDLYIHELTHDMRHAAGFPCH